MGAQLTIAIPTYNRCEILDSTLKSLLSDPYFDPNKIEVVVSDDASPDATAEVVAKYPLVKYYRNAKNLKFGNHTVAMNMANGKYIKLINDTASLRPGALCKMLKVIEQAERENLNLFIANPLLGGKKGVMVVDNGVEFMDKVSFLIGWSVNTGLWRDDFKKLPDPNRAVKSDMHQVDWILTACAMGRKTMIVADDFFDIASEERKTFNYNFFDVFINKYLSILKFHNIKGWPMEKEKYRLFRYFVIPWYFNLKNKDKYKSDTTNQNKIILKNYWYEPYLVPMFLLKMALNIISK